MIEVSFQGKNLPEIKKHMIEFIGGGVTVSVEPPQVLSAQVEMDLEPEPVAEPKKKAKKKASKKKAAAEPEVKEVTGDVSREQVHVALQAVNASAGLPRAREILKEFGAQRLSELKEEIFPAFVLKCNEVSAEL